MNSVDGDELTVFYLKFWSKCLIWDNDKNYVVKFDLKNFRKEIRGTIDPLPGLTYLPASKELRPGTCAYIVFFKRLLCVFEQKIIWQKALYNLIYMFYSHSPQAVISLTNTKFLPVLKIWGLTDRRTNSHTVSKVVSFI